MTLRAGSIPCLVGLLSFFSTSAVQADPPKPAPSLASLAAELEGTWEATSPSGKRILVTYALVSGGTTLMERFGEGPRASLTTYHADGDCLLLTHYCPQGNQPRLRARMMKGDTLAFDDVDVTNRQADQSMLRALTYRFERGPTKGGKGAAPLRALVRTETYVGPDGKDEVTTLRFVRVKPAAKR